MKSLLTILLLTMISSAQAAGLADTNASQFDLNRASPQAMFKWQLGTKLVKQRLHAIKCVYDFSKQGGAIGAILLKDEDLQTCVLPSKAIVRDVLIDVVTAPTSGGAATIAIGSGQTATDFKAATAIASYTGLVAGIPVGTAATAIKMTADRQPKITVATAALTAGKLNVQIEYEISE